MKWFDLSAFIFNTACVFVNIAYLNITWLIVGNTFVAGLYFADLIDGLIINIAAINHDNKLKKSNKKQDSSVET